MPSVKLVQVIFILKYKYPNTKIKYYPAYKQKDVHTDIEICGEKYSIVVAGKPQRICKTCHRKQII